MCCNIDGRSFKYADDLTILSSGLNAAQSLEVMHSLEGNIEVLATWLNNWRMQVSLTKTTAMILDKKTTIIETQASLIFEGHQIKITDAVKVLGVIIDDKLNFGQQYTAATNGAIQTFESIKRSYLSNKSISPNTFKTLCQSIVVPKWTYLAFIWGSREKFRNSQLWAEIVNLSTCSTYNPKKELLELIGNNVPIDIQTATHGAKFAIKVSQQNQDDRVYCLFNNSNSPIIKKLIADSRRFGSPLYYSQESMKELTYRRWNDRIRILNLSGNTGLKAKIEGVLPKHLSKAHTRRMVQLLTEHSNLGYFQFLIGRCFSPVCTCLIAEETTAHFLYRCPFYSNLRRLEPPKKLEELLESCKWENWKSTLCFVELSRRLDKAK